MQYPLSYNGITQPFKKGVHNGIDLGWNLLHGGTHAKIYCVDDGVVHSIQSQQLAKPQFRHTQITVLILRT